MNDKNEKTLMKVQGQPDNVFPETKTDSGDLNSGGTQGEGIGSFSREDISENPMSRKRRPEAAREL